MQPFFSRNTGTALRDFTAAVNEEGSAFNRHSEDYSLWRVGEFEETAGKIGSVVPVQIASAHEMRDWTDSSADLKVPQGGE